MTPLAPPSPQGYPAPFWLLEALKVLGFVLHVIHMNIWYAGMPLAFLTALFGGVYGRRLSKRLGMAMPIVLALGVNFGIVPLLFTQVVNYQFFYAAGVLIAWPWFSVIPLLTVAYYGVYIHAKVERRRWLLTAAGISGAILITIGFLFANNFSLMTNVPEWLAIFRRTAVAGAPHGVALNLGDTTLMPRWLMMFGIAIMTTSAYVIFDAAFLARRETEEYRRWAGRTAFLIYTLGLLWFAGAGSWYFFGTLSPQVRDTVFTRPGIQILVAATVLSPGLVWVLALLWWRMRTNLLAILVASAQILVIILNAISRQWVQNMELNRYLDLAAVPTRTQWGALIVFVSAFAIAIALSAWMVVKLWRAWKVGEVQD